MRYSTRTIFIFIYNHFRFLHICGDIFYSFYKILNSLSYNIEHSILYGSMHLA